MEEKCGIIVNALRSYDIQMDSKSLICLKKSLSLQG